MGLSFFRQYEEVAQKQNNLHSQGRQEKDDWKMQGTKLHAHLNL